MTVPKVPSALVSLLFLGLASSRAGAADLGLDLVGKWPPFGSLPQAIVVEGDHAYCLFPTLDIIRSLGGGLGIFDVSRPTAPSLAGSYRSPNPKDVSVRGNHAYLADGLEGLVIVDVSDPARPRRVGGDLLDVEQNGGGGLRLFVSGSRAYVVGGGDNRLYVIDVSDPREPRRLGILGGLMDAEDVFVAGDLACVTGRSSGLHLFDVSDPAAPSRIGGFASDNCSNSDVFVAGKHVYLRSQCGIHVIDIGDPSAPMEVSRLPAACLSVFVSGDLGYCAGDGLWVFDLSDPAHPRQVGSLDGVVAAGFDADPGGPVFASGAHVYVAGTHASSGHAGLQVVDVGDPAFPRWVGAAATKGSARDVAAAAGHAHVIDSFGLLVFDVSDPENPRPVARQLLDRPMDVALSENQVHVAGWDGLQVFDVTEPRSPRLAGTYRTNGPIHEVALSGDRAYLGVGTEIDGFLVGSAVEILDVSDAASPSLLGRHATSNSNLALIELAAAEDRLYLVDAGVLDILDVTNPARVARLGGLEGVSHLALLGDRAFVDSGGLLAVDVADPTRPRPLGNPVPFTSMVTGISIAGHHALVVLGNLAQAPSLESFDVSDPSRLEAAGRYAFEYDCGGLAISEGRAYAAAGDLLVLDAGRPANPERIGAYRADRPANGVFVSGKHAYVSADDAGLLVLDVSDPRSPELAGRYGGEPFLAGTTNSAVRTFVSGSLAFVAANTGGLAVIDVSDPASPRLAGAVALPGLANHVVVQGEHAFVEDNYLGNGMWVIDVSRPDLPRVVGRYPVDGSGLHTLSLAGDNAYLGTSFALEVLGLEDLANPRRVGLLDVRTGFAGSSAAGDLVFASSPLSGLHVIDVTRPESPRRAGKYLPDAGACEELHVAGKYAYVANRMTGLEVLDVSDPESPRLVGGNRFLAGTEIWQVFATEAAVFVAAGAEGLVILDAFRDDDDGAHRFRRGDSDADGKIDLTDAIHILEHLFRGGPEPECLEAADIDDNGAINVTDPVRLLNHLFQGGPAPESPGPAVCGQDPPGSPDTGCRDYPGCPA